MCSCSYRGLQTAYIFCTVLYCFFNTDSNNVCRQTDIERSLPVGAPSADLEWSPVVSTLRQLVDEAQTIKDERDTLEMQLKEVKGDMGEWSFYLRLMLP